MLFSSKTPHFIIRFGLAAVFIWFGVNKFINPDFWLTAWVPAVLMTWADKFGLAHIQIIYASAVFEILVGLSLLTSVLVKLFSTLAFLYLAVILIVNGITDFTVRDMGLMGALLALLFWPKVRSRY